MEETPEQENPGQLMFEMMAMPEFKLREQLLGFKTSIYILQVNFKELETLIEFLVNPSNANAPSVITNPERLPSARAEVTRRLHNFVAAAQSLVDHTRVLYRKLYEGSNRFPDYQSHVEKQFVHDPLAQFVQRLRQYCQHYKSPAIGVNQSFTRAENELIDQRAVYLQPSQLLEFDGWNVAARKYIDSLGGENVDVLAVARAYRDKVTDFYAWFEGRQSEIHAEELNRLDEKEARFHLREIEVSINMCLNNPGNMPYGEDGVFFPLFSGSNLNELAGMGGDRDARASRAVELLETRFQVPERLKDKIRKLYQEPSFLAPRASTRVDDDGQDEAE